MKYDGEEVELTPEQEEVATFFGVMLETDHAKKPVFQKNFFKCFRELLGKNHKIKKFSKCDFRPIYDWAMERKEEQKILRKQNKEKIKAEKERLLDIYGYALVDGFRERVGNYNVEPPGLFRGRGEHPKTGLVKKRVKPEQITLNIGKGAKIPKCPMAGHNWKGVIHNPKVTWLAYWIDNINGDYKYVWLAASSKFKGMSDFLKYEKSRKLKDVIGRIRDEYNKLIKSAKDDEYEMAVAIYLIDRLALRMGNEKGEDKADTVGCCSLRAEHIFFVDEDMQITAEDTFIRLKFLGKDSMPYDEKIKIEKPFYKKLYRRTQSKKQQLLFNKINPNSLNAKLQTYMDKLSAKVFRTYNASITLQRELEKCNDECTPETSLGEKTFIYNRCNRIVAELCNHQRSIPKGHANQVEKMEAKMEEYVLKKEAMEEHIDMLKGAKKKGKKAKKKAKKEEDGEKTFKFSNNADVMDRQYETHLSRISNLETKMKTKDETKAVALGTSKINYMDPRITVAWCKRNEVPLEKVFNAALITKFPWAMEVQSTWRY
eukprot:jgi/Bigna1/48614/estExt_Genewise1.C_290087